MPKDSFINLGNLETYRELHKGELEDYVKFDDYASRTKTGVVRTDGKTIVAEEGVIKGAGAPVAGKTYSIDGESVVAKDGAEVFNAYDGTNKAIGIYSHAEGHYTTASGSYSHAEGNSTTASIQNAHAEGHSTTASGSGSHSEGYETTASGDYSHSEGRETTASGDYSHSEGYQTIASTLYSHAEGYDTTASGTCSHAEGFSTTASGYAPHAEGSGTTTSGYAPHAEGFGTTASGDYSHSEGYRTKASSDYQHVQGKFNIEDANDKYAFIIGNGTADDKRSNAFAVDWEGKIYQNNATEGVDLSVISTKADKFLDLYVDATNGSNSNDGLTSSTALKTLDKAIEMIKNTESSIIRLAAGTYSVTGNAWTIKKKNVNIVGTDRENTIIKSHLALQFSTIGIEGVTINNTDLGHTSAAINVTGCDLHCYNVNIITDCKCCIRTNGGSYNTIQITNFFAATEYCMYTEGMSHTQMYACKDNSGLGIYCEKNSEFSIVTTEDSGDVKYIYKDGAILYYNGVLVSNINPVEQGGTGASTEYQARLNLKTHPTILLGNNTNATLDETTNGWFKAFTVKTLSAWQSYNILLYVTTSNTINFPTRPALFNLVLRASGTGKYDPYTTLLTPYADTTLDKINIVQDSSTVGDSVEIWYHTTTPYDCIKMVIMDVSLRSDGIGGDGFRYITWNEKSITGVPESEVTKPNKYVASEIYATYNVVASTEIAQLKRTTTQLENDITQFKNMYTTETITIPNPDSTNFTYWDVQIRKYFGIVSIYGQITRSTAFSSGTNSLFSLEQWAKPFAPISSMCNNGEIKIGYSSTSPSSVSFQPSSTNVGNIWFNVTYASEDMSMPE